MYKKIIWSVEGGICYTGDEYIKALQFQAVAMSGSGISE